MDSLSTYLLMFIFGAFTGVFITIAILRAIAGLPQRRIYSSGQLPIGAQYPVVQYEDRWPG